MKIYSILSLLLPALLFTFAVNAEMYKGLDDEGNVIYSDKPFDNSEKFTPPSLSIVDAPKIPPKEEVIEEEKPAETKYTAFSIVSPTNNETIWNEPQLIVSVRLKPALNTVQGHNIWLLMDDKPLVKNSKSLSLPIGRADRGEHKLQAQIKNKKGKIIKRTKTVTVHIKNTVVPQIAPFGISPR
ncbi:MAG: hypothetical protein ACC650_03725 [Gammaproteobacteria bacterium]